MTEAAGSNSGYQSGTGSGLLAFLKRLGERGEINGSTADNLRRAAAKMLALEGDLDEVDIRDLDADDLMYRFETLHRLNYNADSIQTYKSRFRQAVTLYQAFLAGSPDWKASVKRDGPSKSQSSRPAQRRIVKRVRPVAKPDMAPNAPADPREATSSAARADDAPAVPRLVTYDVPLRPDLIIRLNLPVDLTDADAERLAAFVRSLAFVSAPSAVAPGRARKDE
jgi:hypothetical protein